MRVEAAGGTACMSRPMGATPKIENATVKTRARERSLVNSSPSLRPGCSSEPATWPIPRWRRSVVRFACALGGNCAYGWYSSRYPHRAGVRTFPEASLRAHRSTQAPGDARVLLAPGDEGELCEMPAESKTCLHCRKSSSAMSNHTLFLES